MHTLYLADNGLQLKKISNRILVKKDGSVLREIPVLDLKRIIIFGNNQLSTQLMRFLSGKGIEVAFLSSVGRFKFRVVPETSKNIYLRMAQHDCYRDRSFRVEFSRKIVGAKIRNQRSLIIRYQRNQPEVDLEKHLDTLKKLTKQLGKKESLNEILGMEGFGSKTFFEAYGKLILGGFEFVNRNYHPPKDPINALLSFGYMMLFNELNSLLEAFGFDVYLGFLHSVRYGRASLANDLMEELRSPVVDRLVLYLINIGAIKPSQFVSKGNKGVLMSDIARETFLSNYEKFMTADFHDAGRKKQTNYRKIIKERVLELERLLLHKSEYSPYLFY